MSTNDDKNIYLPYRMTIEKITLEAPGVRTFRLRFQDPQQGEAFSFPRRGNSANIPSLAKANRRSASLPRPRAKDTSSAPSARPGG